MARDSQQKQGGSIASRRGPRRRRPVAEKLAIIRECLQPGASLAGIALAHGANANMVRKWVVKYQQGAYGPVTYTAPAMLPVVVKPNVARRSRTTPHAMADSTPMIEVELGRGVLRVHGKSDLALLRALIDALSV